ncbi:hypothetical protein K3H46_19830, partial [Aeromonas veronii]|uniref:hypothetical protein n=1 Tax=Aeromonas veronii TaxID=654 RepID=UPI001F1FB0C4
KKSETNQQVSDFHTTEGSVNGSLTDRHYWQQGLFLSLIAGKRRTNGDGSQSTTWPIASSGALVAHFPSSARSASTQTDADT